MDCCFCFPFSGASLEFLSTLAMEVQCLVGRRYYGYSLSVLYRNTRGVLGSGTDHCILVEFINWGVSTIYSLLPG